MENSHSNNFVINNFNAKVIVFIYKKTQYLEKKSHFQSQKVYYILRKSRLDLLYESFSTLQNLKVGINITNEFNNS